MFDESKHPRDEAGKFTDGTEETGKEYRQNTDYNEIAADGVSKNTDLDNLLGEEFKGYKGQAAIDKLMQERHGHVKAAFHRDDIGDIDLLWGNERCGLMHIVVRRNEQGIDIANFVKDLAIVISEGRFRKKNDRGNFEFMLNNKIAVISPELYGNKVQFLLTAYKTHSKK